MENGLQEIIIDVNYTEKKFHKNSFVCRVFGSFKDYLVISYFDVFDKLKKHVLPEYVEKEDKEIARPIFINIKDKEVTYTSVEDVFFLKGLKDTNQELENELEKKKN